MLFEDTVKKTHILVAYLIGDHVDGEVGGFQQDGCLVDFYLVNDVDKAHAGQFFKHLAQVCRMKPELFRNGFERHLLVISLNVQHDVCDFRVLENRDVLPVDILFVCLQHFCEQDDHVGVDHFMGAPGSVEVLAEDHRHQLPDFFVFSGMKYNVVIIVFALVDRLDEETGKQVVVDEPADQRCIEITFPDEAIDDDVVFTTDVDAVIGMGV